MQCAISAHSYRRGTLCILAIVSYLKIFDGLPIPVPPLLYPDFTRWGSKIFFLSNKLQQRYVYMYLLTI